MKRRLIAVVAALSASLAAAQEPGVMDGDAIVEAWRSDPTTIFRGDEVDLDAFRWVARPVVVFSDTPENPAFVRQVDMIEERVAQLAERDVVVVFDADPEANSDLRQRLRPRGFMLVLMNKSGDVALRKPAPWDVREITRSIDKTPERQQELKDQRHLGRPLTD